MKYQIPLDLIDQIQINLKNEANLHSFNQFTSSIPPLPSIEQAISSIELSSDNIRCNNCNGSFLRGFESVICIYCGQHNHQKSIPQSIPFKSTIGFRLLLDSLGLESSESVGSPSVHDQSNEGQSSLKDKISLADLLDLDLKWHDELNSLDIKRGEIYPKKGFLNLVGEGFDSSFAEGSREHASRISVEQVTREKFGTKESAKFEEQNTESYEAVLRSADGEHGESSAWEAEFQSPNQDTAYENLQSSNVSILPRVEGGIHNDSVSIAPSSSNLTDTDPSSSSEPVNSSSKFDWSAEDLQKSSIAHPLDDEKRADDDAIDEWGEFRAVAGPENNHPKSSSGGLDFSDAWNDFSGSVPVEPSHLQTGIYKMPNDESLSLWNNSASESKAEDIHSDSRSINMNQHVERHGSTDPMVQRNDIAFGQQQDQINILTERIQHSTCSQTDETELESPQISFVIQNDPLDDKRTKSSTHMVAEADSIDFWNDFKSSTVERQETSNTGADDKIHYGVGNSIPGPNVTESTHDQISVKKAPENQRVTADNGTFDLWGDFGPSTLVSETQSQGAGAELSKKNSTGIDNDFFDGWNYSGNSNGITVNKVTPSSANDDALDSWSEFASPFNVRPNSSINPANASDSKEAVKLTDPFDTWNTFASSSGVQTHGDTKVVNESASERDVSETSANLQDGGSSIFTQADQLFSTISDEKCSTQADASLAPEGPDSSRMENGDVKADDIHVEVMNKSEITTKPSHPSSSNVETLISEMHDLSFMLESTLSVPSSKS